MAEIGLRWAPAWGGAAVVAVLSAITGGCTAGSSTPLPELTRPAQPVLSQAEQAKAIKNLEEEAAKVNAQSGK